MKKKGSQSLRLIKGGIGIDDRGEVGFVNDFDFAGVKRFYTVMNFKRGFVRAWHGHRKETKYFTVVRGAALICGVEIDNWKSPSKDLQIQRFVLSEKAPSVVCLPAGYANGAMSLTDDCKIVVFSTSTLEDSLSDDVRFPSKYWNPWDIEER